MKKSIFIFVMIVFILNTLFSSAIPQNSKIITLKNNNTYYTKSSNSDEKSQGHNTNVDTAPKIIASIPEEKIYLYALNEQEPWYQGLVLSIDGVNKFFNWKTLSMIEVPPKLYYLDLNNDDKKELVVILYEDRGTGISLNTMHIINPEDFTEYKFKNALDVIKDNVEIKILSKKEVEMKINDTIYNVKIGDVPPNLTAYYPIQVSDIFFKHYIKYSMEDNVLKARVGAEARPLKYLGDIIIDYSFKDDEFKANKIVFEGNPTVTVTTHKLNKTK
ncbi:hypothetical protein [Tepidibacter formicigenes]|jgi:hypothetical protein|uniref:Copper amine oxidase N-terminal domain-containing protein n=1 Tax=Tepidibacter formicigenes DSM 15518 TaxID=1123349 RepID=A0A1M6TR81_9FIRM|nr:hypothetical protein [Tepidibacter formicigenes]SHK59409.1 hypothetical protein SAMN02744037_02658 [Tepidibacter formicigenes DSM 15518]